MEQFLKIRAFFFLSLSLYMLGCSVPSISSDSNGSCAYSFENWSKFENRLCIAEKFQKTIDFVGWNMSAVEGLFGSFMVDEEVERLRGFLPEDKVYYLGANEESYIGELGATYWVFTFSENLVVKHSIIRR